jgi:CTP synthase
LFCDIDKNAVIEAVDDESIYEVPLALEKQGFAEIVIKRLALRCGEPDLEEWIKMVEKFKNPRKKATIALVGKYVELQDAYLSVAEALRHAGIYHDTKIDIRWVHTTDVENGGMEKLLQDVDGVLVPGGFGDRGINGKIKAIQYAREHNIPFLGICLGMQLGIVEFARHVCGLKEANSTEFNEDTPYPVIDLLPEQKEIAAKGGTMRLGLSPCKLVEGTLAHQAYGEELIYERHRHRYEVNNHYRSQLVAKGLVISGTSPDESLVEIIELKDHPWFVASQFHPEFKSRPNRPHPLFRDFIGAALEKSN